jgi:hypothetical protein
MWVFEQSTGKIYHNGQIAGFGYSGAPEAKNDPSRQAEPNVGPIPRSYYAIGHPIDTKTHGPMVLPLDPLIPDELLGRSGFLIHGDSIVAPGTASEGCIIMPRAVREAIVKSNDHLLKVVASLEV